MLTAIIKPDGFSRKPTQQRVDSIRPSDRCPYIDMLCGWHSYRPSSKELDMLAGLCGHLYSDDKNPSPWGRDYPLRLDLKQPSQEALEMLARWERQAKLPAKINRFDPALDLTFGDSGQLSFAKTTVNELIVKKSHRDQGVRFKEETRYTGARTAPNQIVTYEEECCRITGEVDCLHIEWRANGIDAVRRVGIETYDDVLAFDHRRFWEPRLLLYAIDLDRLGRLATHRRAGQGRRLRRTAWIDQCGPYTYNRDQSAGGVLKRLAGGSTQEVIDLYRKRFNVQSALVRMRVDHLLPEAATLL